MGGRYDGYLGDIARMAVMGQPSAQQDELLHEVVELQAAARSAVRPGAAGLEIYEAFERELASTPHRDLIHFIAEGIGLVGHEAPRIAPPHGARLVSGSPLPNAGEDGHTPLRAGMVLSVETSVTHPEVGLVKLEDQIIVTEDGYEAIGDGARGWTAVG